MPTIDWMLVVLGAAVTLPGGWIQINPERVFSVNHGDLRPDPASLAKVRRLGASFVFMGAFFALQMVVDLARLPWWAGTVSGGVAGILAVRTVKAQGRRAHPLSDTQPSSKD
jgi:hypothetical protein